MGVVKKPSIESYWEKDEVFATPFFPKVMSRNHFQSILSCFHYCDDTLEKQKAPAERDRLKKLSGFIASINDAFKCYSPEQQLSIDEGGCPYKGRISFRVFNQNKPNRWSIKTFQLCESLTGYTLNVCVYDGTAPKWEETIGVPKNASVTELLVMRLLKDGNCLHKGHHLYMDNYYNSPNLFTFLEEQGVLAAGTVSLARKNIPLLCRVKPMKKVPPELRGRVLWSRKGNLLCLVWYDKRRVATLSTIHKAEAVKAINMRKQEVVKPAVVADYCKYMFGVDLSDQKAYYYTPLRRSYKWWRKLFFHLFNVCVLNAHVLHSKYADKKLTLYEFRRELALALITRGQLTSRLPRAAVSLPNTARFTDRHFPAHNEFSPLQLANAAHNKKRKTHPSRKCVVCRHESVYRCPDCAKCLCAVDCFRKYHTEVIGQLQRVQSNASESSFSSDAISESDESIHAEQEVDQEADEEMDYDYDQSQPSPASSDWNNWHNWGHDNDDSEIDFNIPAQFSQPPALSPMPESPEPSQEKNEEPNEDNRPKPRCARSLENAFDNSATDLDETTRTIRDLDTSLVCSVPDDMPSTPEEKSN